MACALQVAQWLQSYSCRGVKAPKNTVIGDVKNDVDN